MNEVVLLSLSGILLGLGLYGVLTKKNIILTIASIEIMINSAIFNFIIFSSYNNNPAGDVVALFFIALAASEVAVGLALALMMFRIKKTLNIDVMNSLRW
ncbi:MAG: NADH-quinone oxidoreductase subunit NuoK [Candidatus Thermoplasmatota archaeon]|nr:NADH-quinone oxidoreductase subunit NuoK [Candidatus Thermoplasmatota archaeon]